MSERIEPMPNPRLAQITMKRDEVISLLKSYAQGGQMAEQLLKVVARNAASMLHRDRAIDARRVTDV